MNKQGWNIAKFVNKDQTTRIENIAKLVNKDQTKTKIENITKKEKIKLNKIENITKKIQLNKIEWIGMKSEVNHYRIKCQALKSYDKNLD